MYRADRNKGRRYALELKIAETLRKRLADGDGFTRIKMKSDGAELDITLCYGGKYHVSFPPYYGDADCGCGKMPYKPLDAWFGGLDEIAEFIVRESWKQRWN